MNFEKLLQDNKIQSVEKKEPDFDNALNDIKTAKKIFHEKDYGWSMAIAYNSVLRSGNQLMNYLGYRPIGKEHHKNLFEFLKECDIDNDLVEFFDKIRIKRNDFIYRDVMTMSVDNAKEIMEKAENLVLKIRTFVLKKRTIKK